MQKEKLLMTPGPTMLPPSVLEIMGRQIIHHRTSDFEETWDELHENLKYIFQTKETVMTMCSSGTGAMEAAVVNLFSPGDKVLAVSIGAFGDRFAEIAKTFGLDVVKLAVEWGNAVNVKDIKDILLEDINMEIKGVLITHNETSTGVTNDIEAVARITRETDRLLVVDAISSLGGLELKMDEWGIDCVVTGSQKALMAPPGLSFIALSQKAWKAYENSRTPKFYWDLKKYRNGLEKLSENPPYTPAITTIMAQAEALRLMRQEGMDKIYKRHEKASRAVCKGVSALGLSLLPEESVSSYIITAVKCPQVNGINIDIGKVIKSLNNDYDIMVTGGQKQLKGKIFRIGHCGFFDGFDIIKTFSALEQVLRAEGYVFVQSSGVRAVTEELFKE